MKIGLGENLGDARMYRDPTADAALKARLADPAKTAADDAAQRAAHAALLETQDQRRATEKRLEILAARFCDWAVVADVLQQEDGLEGPGDRSNWRGASVADVLQQEDGLEGPGDRSNWRGASVADVLQQEDGLEGDALAAAVESEKGLYPTADAWMRANF